MTQRSFAITVDIAAPPERVWAVMSDPEGWPQWTRSVKKIVLLDPPPIRVGHRARIHQPRLPPALWKITRYEPGRSFTWVSWAPGVNVVAHHLVEPADVGTRATLSIRYDGLFGGALAWLTQRINRAYLRMEAEGLKARSEGTR